MILSLGFIVVIILVKPNHRSFEVVLIDCAVNNMVTSFEPCDTFQLPYLLQYPHSTYIILFQLIFSYNVPGFPILFTVDSTHNTRIYAY